MASGDDKNFLTSLQQTLLRSLPGVDELVGLPVARQAEGVLSRREIVAAARTIVDEARQVILASNDDVLAPLTQDDWATRLKKQLDEEKQKGLQPVINATGVVLHTNLGRAPLSDEALDHVVRVARGYSNLEYDIARGGRGSRHDHVRRELCALCEAEDVVVVNNNAGAVLLTLSALTAGREVVLSRGEMVEIGGSFRIPDVLEQSGARLVEVGTTNRTRSSDYEKAIGPDTAAIVKVHPSNYRIVGFSEGVSTARLSELARERDIYLIEDLGSGSIVTSADFGLGEEPTVQQTLRAGADVVTFSGDKLLGGPQIGVIAGKAELVRRCRDHPLARALRVDKLVLAALQGTLKAYRSDRFLDVPIWGIIAADETILRRRATALAENIRRRLRIKTDVRREPNRRDTASMIDVSVCPSESTIGGGALPGERLPTWVVALSVSKGGEGVGSVDAWAQRLRACNPAVVGRVEDGRLVLDVRTVFPREEEALVAGVAAVLTGEEE